MKISRVEAALSAGLLSAVLGGSLAVVAPASASPAAMSAASSSVSATPRLVDVRASHRAGFDRVVFEFQGGMPAEVRARFVGKLIADGSGREVRIAGRAVLEVAFDGTGTTGATTAPRRRAFPLPNVMTAVRSGLFEGVTTYGVGLAKQTSFIVRKQPARSRVVVDIRAAFPTVLRDVYFFDVDAFIANQEPFFVARKRPVPSRTPAVGVMDRLFAGPLPSEQADNIRLLRSHARDFANLRIGNEIARVRLVGACSSDGSTATIAGEITPTLRQFASVDWVKIYDPSGHTADPTGPSDSIPDCLNP
jgi:hypothetical protein